MIGDISVRQLLRRKGTDVVTTAPETTVYDAIAKMVDHNVGSIVVIEDEQVAGIFTERDYLRQIALKGRTSKTTSVQDVMTTEVLVADLNTTVEEALAIMTEARCRHLPVISTEGILGIVSIGDCVKELLRAAEAEVDSLQAYVRGRYPG